MNELKTCLLAPNKQIEFCDVPRWPMLASLKMDGFRCLCVGGKLYSRNLKPPRNSNIEKHLSDLVNYSRSDGWVFDMELYDHNLGTFEQHASILTKEGAEIPETMQAHVFDCMHLDQWNGEIDHLPFEERFGTYTRRIQCLGSPRVVAVEQILQNSPAEAMAAFDAAVELGYEGIMLRCPNAPYKHGRATEREGIIFKFKSFATDDGRIVEVVQRRKMKEAVRTGAREIAPTGGLARIHTKDSFELDDMVGAFKVEFADGRVSEINYGRGFAHETRRQHWKDRDSLIGKHVEVRHLPHGAGEGIRIGTLVRFRPDKD